MFAEDSRQLNIHLLSRLIVDKHSRCSATNMAFSQDHGKSTLFSSERTDQSVPFSHVRDKAIYDHAAGDNMVGLETNSNHENLMENLDELSEEQLDEMIREAHDINQRLRSLERKQHKHARGESMADQEERTIEEYGSRQKRAHFLPPLQQSKTPLVTQVGVMKGIVSTKPDRVGRKKKSTVT